MPSITNVIDISVTRLTAAINQFSFGTVMFLSPHTAFSERTKIYTELESVLEDFEESSEQYKAAAAAFAQSTYGKVSKFMIGRKHVTAATVDISTVTASATYTVTVNGTDYSFVADADPTTQEIVDGLVAEYSSAPITGITISTQTSSSITFSSTVEWSLKVDSKMSVGGNVSSESWTDAIAAVTLVNPYWYCLTTSTIAPSDVLTLAAFMEGGRRIYATRSSDAADLTAATTGIGAQLNSFNYHRTFVMYSPYAATQYIDVAWAASQLMIQPGKNTWANKSLSAVQAYIVSDTQYQYAVQNKVNLYTGLTYAGVEIESGTTLGGYMASGEWIDTMVFIDWTIARMTERLWYRMKNTLKIPHTPVGYAMIESDIRAQLIEGIAVGGFADFPAPRITVPTREQVSAIDKANRRLTGVTWSATLAGAVHHVTIGGTVTN